MNRIELNLQAGKRYLTVHDDGTAGPVVELKESCLSSGVRQLIPFEFMYYWVAYDGRCAPASAIGQHPVLQITGEYHEPTIAERLERLKEAVPCLGDLSRFNALLDELVAAVRKLEGSK